MAKPNMNIEVECLIVASAKQILLTETDREATISRLGLSVRCAEEFMGGLRMEVEGQLKGSVLDSKSRLKPAEKTVVELSLEEYETEEMKFAQMIRKQQDLTSNITVRYEASVELGTMLMLQPEVFRQYVFGRGYKSIEVAVDLQETHSIIKLTKEEPDELVNARRKEMLQRLRSVYIFNHTFPRKSFMQHFKSILSRDPKLLRDVSLCEDPKDILKLYIYTKDKGLAEQLLKHVSSLACKEIDVRLIFRSKEVRFMFWKNQLERIQRETSDLWIVRQEDSLTVVGQLHRLMQFETYLHQLYLSFRVRTLEWKANPLSKRILHEKQQELVERNKQIKEKNRDRRLELFYTQQNRTANQFDITLVSRSISELENEFRTLVLSLQAIKQQIVKVGMLLSTHLHEDIGGDSRLERLSQKMGVALVLEKQYLLIYGVADNIDRVKTILSQIKLEANPYQQPQQDTVEKKRPKEQPQSFELVFSERQLQLLEKELFSDQLIIQDRRSTEGVFVVTLKTIKLDEAILLKTLLLSFILRTKESSWLQFPETWTQHPATKTVRVGYPTGGESAYLKKLINLSKQGYIMDSYRVEDRDRYCTFHRIHPNHRPAILLTPLPLCALVNCIENSNEVYLSKLTQQGLAWHFTEKFKPSGRHQTLMVALVASTRLDSPKKTCLAMHEFLPSYLVDISSEPTNQLLYSTTNSPKKPAKQ